jgi:hypothetical protein
MLPSCLLKTSCELSLWTDARSKMHARIDSQDPRTKQISKSAPWQRSLLLRSVAKDPGGSMALDARGCSQRDASLNHGRLALDGAAEGPKVRRLVKNSLRATRRV